MTNKQFEIEVLDNLGTIYDSLLYILRNKVIFDKAILEEIFKMFEKINNIINELKEE